MRVQQREFWVPPGPVAPTPEREGLGSVLVLPGVSQLLRRQLTSPARARGGLLFGYQDVDTLHVFLASTAGSPGWYDRTRREVLAVDPRFALGWSEALFGLWGGRVDWVGNWVAHKDGQIRSEERDHRWFRRGQKLGLFDDRGVLLIPGWHEGVFECRAYSQDSDGQPVEVPCRESTRSLVETVQQLTDQASGPDAERPPR
ncbi:hypothetical protein [Deinococcus planocerae]|uniref:hypothetical protein n=1 Tax=Deinococcus planocerae TaxID=1737569 RepID=UPI0011AF3D84|nr:hypothetical protein [Deinococcus planocerae]